MVRGLFTAYTGMSNEQKRLDIVANNLANSATVGYKEDNVTSQTFDQVLAVKIRDGSEAYNDRRIGRMNLGVKLGEVYTSHGQGSLRPTSNPYQLALEGKGFFVMSVTDRLGNTDLRYTRNGSFTMTQDGFLVDSDGNRVMGEAGEVILPTDAGEIHINSSGDIYADNVFVDRLAIADFEDYSYLIKSGDTMFRAIDEAVQVESAANIRQGYLEQSNVNVVSEMVEMITITRAYEANQKVLRSIDQTLEHSANSIGKV